MEINTRTVSHFFRSKLFTRIVIGVAVIVVVIIIFETGVAVGFREAAYSSHWGANYENNFGGNSVMDEHLPNPHGSIGEIVGVSMTGTTTTIIMNNGQRAEQKIIVDSSTVIRNRENTVTVSALTPGTFAVVLGNPTDEGEIDASLIRIIPSPLSGMNPQGMTQGMNPAPATVGTASPYAAP